MDQLDFAIIDLLTENARRTNKDISQILGVSEATIAARIRNLIDRKAIRIVARQSALGREGHRVLAILDFYLKDSARIGSVATALSKIDNILSVYQTARRPELVAIVRAEDMERFRAVIEIIQTEVTDISQLDVYPIIELHRAHRTFGSLDLPPPPRQPSKDLGERLVHALEADGRQSVRSLARQLNLSDTAVRYRLNKLLFEEGFEIVTISDLPSMGFTVWADVRMTIEPSQLERALTTFRQHENVIIAAHLSGRKNLFLITIAKSVESFDDFINNNVRTLNGISDFSILRIPKALKYNYNVIL